MTLSNEIYWLTLSILLTALMWVPYIINRMQEMGVWPALYNPQPDIRPQKQWAERMMRAHENAVENLIIFAPLVLIVEITQSHSSLSALAVEVYFYARLIHFIVFTFAIPLLRVPAFLTGAGAQLVIALNLLNIISV